MAHEPDDILPPFPAVGRTFAATRLVQPSEVTPAGRTRLDAIADWLQQVAYADVVDAGVAQDAAWVVRRNVMRVARFPRVGETVELRTTCSGWGAFWAERRTSVQADGADAIEAATIWVSLDPASGRPTRAERFMDVYGESAGRRRVRAKLTHPGPPPDAVAASWLHRAADLDLAGHVNNAAYWRAVEEHCAASLADAGARADDGGAGLAAVAEHHAPAAAGPATFLHDGDGRAWLLGADGVLHASFALRSESAATG